MLDFQIHNMSELAHILGTIVYVATKIGGCPGLGAKYISQSAVVASPGNCSAMGGRINSNNREYCDLDWCVTNRLIPEGIYIR